MIEVYLDNSATTRPFKDITDRLGDIAYKYYANPSSLHKKGIETEKLVIEARKIVAKSLNISDNEIYFTSGGTESNNIAIKGFINANKRNIGTIVTTEIEHPSVLKVFRNLELEGFDVEYLKVDKFGIIDLEYFENILKTKKVSFFSLAHVNNEVGAIQPLNEITRLKKMYKFSLHIDAVQSYCKINIKNYIEDIDFLSASGHKIHSIKGTGILYINKNSKVLPLVEGGGQESSIRSGTENIVGIWAFGQAVKVIDANINEFENKVNNIKKYFIDELKENFEVNINNSLDINKSSPYIVSVSFVGIPGEVMLHSLEAENIFVSTGSACSSKNKGVSHVFKAMNINNKIANSVVRFSLSIETTKGDIDICIDKIKEIVKKLR